MDTGTVLEIAQCIFDNCPDPAMDDPHGSFWEFFGEEIYRESKKDSWPDELSDLEVSAILYMLWKVLDGNFGEYFEWYSILNDLSEDPLFGEVLLDAFEYIEDGAIENAGQYIVALDGWHRFLMCGHWPRRTEDVVVNRWIRGYYMEDDWFEDYINTVQSHADLMETLMHEIELYGKEKIISKVRHEIFLVSAPRIQPVEGEFRRVTREEWMDERQIALEELENLLSD